MGTGGHIREALAASVADILKGLANYLITGGAALSARIWFMRSSSVANMSRCWITSRPV